MPYALLSARTTMKTLPLSGRVSIETAGIFFDGQQLQRRDDRGRVLRGDDDALDALADQGLHVCGELRDVVRGVRRLQRDAE